MDVIVNIKRQWMKDNELKYSELKYNELNRNERIIVE